MDFPNWEVLQQAGGGLAVIAVVLFLIYRDNRKSGMNELIQAAQQRRQDIESLRSDVKDLRQQRHDDVAELEHAKRDLQLLRYQVEEQQQELAEQIRWRSAAVKYITTLRQFISTSVSGNGVPEVPEDLKDDFG